MKTIYSTFISAITLVSLTACSATQSSPAVSENSVATDTVSRLRSREEIEPVRELPVEEQKKLMQFK